MIGLLHYRKEEGTVADVIDGRLYIKTKKVRDVLQVIPDAVVTTNGVSVEHNIGNFMILRRMGARIDGYEPINYNWVWPKLYGISDLFPHQKKTAAFLTTHFRAYCLHPPRMGKTAAALAAAFNLFDTVGLQSMLIVCPIAAVGDWEREIYALRPNERAMFLHGKLRGAMSAKDNNHRIFIINPDGLKAEWKNIAKFVENKRLGLIVFDELTEYQNVTTDRWKAARNVSKMCQYVWGMTGTPGTPLQTHGQMNLITPGPSIPTSKNYWRTLTYDNPFVHKWIEKPSASLLVHKLMQPSIRFEKKDVFGTRQMQVEFHTVEMSAEQAKAYSDMKRKQLLLHDGAAITAVNAGVAVSKLLQISAGAVRTDDGSIKTLDVTPRVDYVEYVLNNKSESGKLVVFCPFKAVMRELSKSLESRGITTRIIDGDTPQKERVEIVREFTTEKDPRVFIAHPITARYSLELSVADTIIFYGPVLNGAYSYAQAAERINSAKQKSLTPALIHLSSSPAEEKMHNAVRSGANSNETTVALFKSEILGV